MGTGMLKSIVFMGISGEKVCREVVIDFDRILYAVEHKDESGGRTCLVALTEKMSLHLDVPLERIEKILRLHKRYPNRTFNTHPSYEPGDEKPTKPTRKKPRKKN